MLATDLARLDRALVGLRRLWESPAVKRRFTDLLGRPAELSLIRTLRAIHGAPEVPGVRHVADALQVDGSTASRFVDQAVAAGCVTRDHSPRDRRRCVLALTAEGQALLDEVTGVRTTLLAELTDGWTAEEIARFCELLERLGEALGDGEKNR